MDTLSLGRINNANPAAAVGGAHVGYYYQLSKSFVVGLYGEGDLSSVNSGKSDSGGGADGLTSTSRSMRNTWQAFLLARAGVAFDRLLVYGTGGLAVADDRESFSIYNSGSTLSYLALESQTNTLIGWAAGVGGEYAFTSHWTASVEVRYASFGKGAAVMPASLPGAGTVTYSPKFSETMALVGLSYQF